jgi:hypothetical protein
MRAPRVAALGIAMKPYFLAPAAALLAVPTGCSSSTSSVSPDAGAGVCAVFGGASGDAGSAVAPGSAGAAGDATTATLVSLSVSTGSLVPAFDAAVIDYTVTSLNGRYPVSVTATASDPSAALFVHGAPAQSGAPSTFTLQPCEDFTVVVGGTTYTVHYAPPDLPAYTVSTSTGAGTEDVLLTANGTYLLVADRSGLPLYYRTFQPDNVENFQQYTLPGGDVVYTTQVGPFDPNGWTLGSIHLMDAKFGDIGDLQLLPNASHGVLPAEGHDFILLDSDHYVAMSYVQRTVDLSALDPSYSSQALVMNAVVQEVSSGDVLLEWDSANVPSLYADSTYSGGFTSTTVSDYLHMNSMTIDPADGNFIFSFRYTSSIVKVDRHTAQILWTLGGKEDQFGLTPDQVFSWQHYARVQPDGSLWVFDNGNNLHQTRIVSFVLDEANKKVVSFAHVYDKPADQPQTTFMGSYAQLGASRYLFGWGGWNGGAIAPDVTEVVDGAPVWSLTFTTPNVFSYRALPIPAL